MEHASLRLAVARHVWAAHIGMLPQAVTPAMTLSGRGVGAVNKWFTNNGYLRLQPAVLDIVILELRKQKVTPRQKEILDILADPGGLLTPHDIFEFLTSCDTVASLEAVVSAVHMRASYNNVSVCMPNEAVGARERVEWWQSRAHPPASKSPTKESETRSPLNSQLKVQHPKAAGLDEEPSPEATRWQSQGSEQELRESCHEHTTGGFCSVCGIRPGYEGRTLKQYGAQLLHSMLVEGANRHLFSILKLWQATCAMQKSIHQVDKQIKKKKKEIMAKEAAMEEAKQDHEQEKKRAVKTRNKNMMEMEARLTEEIEGNMRESLQMKLYHAAFRLLMMVLAKRGKIAIARSLIIWKWRLIC